MTFILYYTICICRKRLTSPTFYRKICITVVVLDVDKVKGNVTCDGVNVAYRSLHIYIFNFECHEYKALGYNARYLYKSTASIGLY